MIYGGWEEGLQKQQTKVWVGANWLVVILAWLSALVRSE